MDRIYEDAQRCPARVRLHDGIIVIEGLDYERITLRRLEAIALRRLLQSAILDAERTSKVVDCGASCSDTAQCVGDRSTEAFDG